MKHESVEQRSMRELAYQLVQRKIASRMLRAGAPVSEQAMAREAGVSRTPMREAIRQLVAEGVLQEVPGRGVVVVRLDLRDLEEIYEIREALEVQAAARLARQLVSDEALASLRALTGEIDGLARGLRDAGHERLGAAQMRRFESANIGFHTYLLQLAGNRRALGIVTGLRTLVRILAMPRLGLTPDLLEKIHRDHCEIVEAIAAGDEARAAAAVMSHVSGSRQTRLEQFVQRERESELPRDLPAFLKRIQSELG
jgi:DNA-binding GntR family transcriptional regulator